MVNLPSFCRFGLSAGHVLLLAGLATTGGGCDRSSAPATGDLPEGSSVAAVQGRRAVSELLTFSSSCHWMAPADAAQHVVHGMG
ncbi:MAG: hypothetical protein ACK5MS_01465, partial [Planctomyces sp.]